MKKPTWSYLIAAGLLLGLSYPRVAHAQDELRSETYSIADQVPQLPGGGGTPALAAAIRAHFRFPADAPRAQQKGTFTVLATVTVNGRVASADVYYADQDHVKPSVQAAAAAVRQLPRLTPAVFRNDTVQYQFTVKVHLTGQPDSPHVDVEALTTGPVDLSGLAGNGDQPSREPVLDQDRAYTFVEQMPTLPGGSGSTYLRSAITERLVVPRDMAAGKVFVRFVVDREGAVTKPTIIRGISPAADAAVLAAVGKLPRFTPGRQNGQPVPVEYTLPVEVRQPSAAGRQ